MRVKEESERAGLKLNIKKKLRSWHLAMTSWKIQGEKVEVVTDFLFLGSKITVDGDCSQEIRKCLPLAWKAMTNRQCVEEQKHYSADKGLYSQSYGLPTGHISL